MEASEGRLADQIREVERTAQAIFDKTPNGTAALRLSNEALERCMFARHFDSKGKAAPARTELREARRALSDLAAIEEEART